MNFWKKLFAGMGFVCGFLVFEAISLAYHNSSRRHKNCKGRCRRNSFWDTLTRYMIFAWIYDGVKKSREQVGRRYYRRTGSEFRSSYDSTQEAIPLNLQKPPRETTVKPASAAEKPLPDTVPDTENLPAPEPKKPQELQQPLRRYVAQADGKLCGYCKEDLCNTENGRMIVELYLGKQEHHVSRILY